MSIKLEHVTYTYSPGTAYEIHALKDVSLEIPQGQFVGIIGHTGSGKSTLIRVLMGLEKPNGGKINLCGKYASRQQRRKKSFYVMQDVDYQFFAGSVLEEMLSGHEKEWNALEKRKRF